MSADHFLLCCCRVRIWGQYANGDRYQVCSSPLLLQGLLRSLLLTVVNGVMCMSSLCMCMCMCMCIWMHNGRVTGSGGKSAARVALTTRQVRASARRVMYHTRHVTLGIAGSFCFSLTGDESGACVCVCLCLGLGNGVCSCVCVCVCACVFACVCVFTSVCGLCWRL